MSETGTLYVIATPIGNLADITLRALDIFKNVKTLYAEDTRVTQRLLEHYGIQANLQSLHDFNESKRISSVIEHLQAGADIGLVSDAGTPLISDPGYKLVSAAQAAGICVRPIPGASALTAALSAAGLPTDRFIFEGFLPKSSSERKKLLKSLRFEKRTLVFYESPQRSPQGAASLEKAQQLLIDMQAHMPLKEAAAIVAKHTGIRRNQLYSLGIKAGNNKDADDNHD